MFPKIFTLPIPQSLQGFLPAQLTLHSYGLMIALGVLAGFVIALRSTRKYGLNADRLSSLFLWVIAAGYVGGKLFFYLEDISTYINDPSRIVSSLSSGFVFYGSLLLAIPTIIWWLKKNAVPVRPFFDVLAIVGPVVHSFGRLGCFMAGCCHGLACDSWIGVVYTHPDSLAEPLHTALYPTQLFDIAVNLAILLVVLLLRKRKQFEGQLFLIYLMLYAIGRSIVEVYRGDEARGFLFGGTISHSQFIAVIIVLSCSVIWYRWRKKARL